MQHIAGSSFAVRQRACLHTCRLHCKLCLQAKGEQMVLDPTLLEEAAASGFMTVIVNSFGELCALQKANGVGISSQEVCMTAGRRGLALSAGSCACQPPPSDAHMQACLPLMKALAMVAVPCYFVCAPAAL